MMMTTTKVVQKEWIVWNKVNYALAVGLDTYKQWAAVRRCRSLRTLALHVLLSSFSRHCHGHEFARASVPPTMSLSLLTSIEGWNTGLPHLSLIFLTSNAHTHTQTHTHVTPLQQQLHWASVPERVSFKLCVLVYRCLYGLGPEYRRRTSGSCPRFILARDCRPYFSRVVLTLTATTDFFIFVYFMLLLIWNLCVVRRS